MIRETYFIDDVSGQYYYVALSVPSNKDDWDTPKFKEELINDRLIYFKSHGTEPHPTDEVEYEMKINNEGNKVCLLVAKEISLQTMGHLLSTVCTLHNVRLSFTDMKRIANELKELLPDE